MQGPRHPSQYEDIQLVHVLPPRLKLNVPESDAKPEGEREAIKSPDVGDLDKDHDLEAKEIRDKPPLWVRLKDRIIRHGRFIGPGAGMGLQTPITQGRGLTPPRPGRGHRKCCLHRSGCVKAGILSIRRAPKALDIFRINGLCLCRKLGH